MSEKRVQGSPRIQVLDVLRGFALAGILVINAMSIMAVKGSTPAFTVELSWPDRLLQDLILFFIESKFFTLFSLLFGIGFAIQIQSADRQGQGSLPRISRRMSALLIFGLAHIALLWDGDILVIYAVTGSLLILFRNKSFRSLKRWVISLLAVPGLLVLLVFVATLVLRLTPEGAAALNDSDSEIAKQFGNLGSTQQLLDSNFVQAIGVKITSYLDLLSLLASRIPTVLAMFLIGLYLGKSNFIREIKDKTAILKKVRFWGLLVGFLLMGLILASTKFLPATTGLVAIIEDQYLAGPILCLGFAAALALAYLKNPNRKVFPAFSTVGRMALTNYLSQSLVLTFLAYGWGLGLASSLGGYQVLAIASALYCVQITLTHLWLKKFAFGPLEWVWRCVTYWRILPLSGKAKGE
jgi:uncharacterized protein